MNRLGSYYSWDIVSDDIAIKKSDVSVFEFRGSGIPQETKWFWGLQHLKQAERLNIQLHINEQQFHAYIQVEPRGRARIFWFSDFIRAIKTRCAYNHENQDFPYLVFKRESHDLYSVDVLANDMITFASSANDIGQNSIFQHEVEGRRRVVCSTQIERSSKNRQACIEYHGLSCAVCGFNFEEKYGELGSGFIEVHHITPLFTFLREKRVDPQNDLVPVCSNCHRMIHKNKDHVLLTDELRVLIR